MNVFDSALFEARPQGGAFVGAVLAGQNPSDYGALVGAAMAGQPFYGGLQSLPGTQRPLTKNTQGMLRGPESALPSAPPQTDAAGKPINPRSVQSTAAFPDATAGVTQSGPSVESGLSTSGWSGGSSDATTQIVTNTLLDIFSASNQQQQAQAAGQASAEAQAYNAKSQAATQMLQIEAFNVQQQNNMAIRAWEKKMAARVAIDSQNAATGRNNVNAAVNSLALLGRYGAPGAQVAVKTPTYNPSFSSLMQTVGDAQKPAEVDLQGYQNMLANLGIAPEQINANMFGGGRRSGGGGSGIAKGVGYGVGFAAGYAISGGNPWIANAAGTVLSSFF